MLPPRYSVVKLNAPRALVQFDLAPASLRKSSVPSCLPKKPKKKKAKIPLKSTQGKSDPNVLAARSLNFVPNP